MTKPKLIQLLKDFAATFGEDISQKLFENIAGVLSQDITEHFQSWYELRETAGLPFIRDPHVRYTTDDVLKAIREAIAKHGPRLSLHAFVRESGISERVIAARCGSWSKARITLGLPPRADFIESQAVGKHPGQKDARPTRQHILDRLHEAVKTYGENISFRQFSLATGFSQRLVFGQFGYWTDLRVAAGLSPYPKPQPRFTREEMLDDLLHVSRQLGANPKVKQHLAAGGKISPFTIASRFGTWKKALAALASHANLRSAD